MTRAANAVSSSHPADGIKPPLKWAGGKRWLIKHLQPLWHRSQSTRLVEPFCGGLAVSLGLRPEQALLNDINPHAINLYNWLKKGLVSRLPMRNEETLYYQHRTDFNRLVTGRWVNSKKAAELFYYLNRTGYNGLCRFNRKGEYNVPFGQHTRINYRRNFSDYQPVLSNWQFSCLDFAELELRHDDFVYADPPYDVPFRQYSKGGFSWSEQVRLVEWLTRHPGPVVLSNQGTARIEELYRDHGFTLTYLDAPRMISCVGDRTPAREVLATLNL